jgi:hypothetical protein
MDKIAGYAAEKTYRVSVRRWRGGLGWESAKNAASRKFDVMENDMVYT